MKDRGGQRSTFGGGSDLGMWERFRDRDYLRWRRKRLLTRFLLTIVSLILLSPLIAVYQFFQIRSTLGFIFLFACVLVLLAINRALGLIGRPYVPPGNNQYQ
jgi:hypothetical protein